MLGYGAYAFQPWRRELKAARSPTLGACIAARRRAPSASAVAAARA